VLSKVQSLFWKQAIHTTTTTNCNVWEDSLVRDKGYVYFDDVNYECHNTAIWDTLDHLRRMQTKLLSVGKDALKDEALMSDMSGALNYWLDNDFKNPNWWFNQIGMVSNLAAIVLMLLDRLTPEQIARAAELIKRGSVAGAPAILKWTGANLIWGIRDTIYHALIIDDKALMKLASDRFADEIYLAEGLEEGMKPDMSFYQHGPILYSCGYGRAFTYETAVLIDILSGSEFAVPEEKVAIFENFVLDGQRYMIRGKSVDYQTVGREIARPGSISSEIFINTIDHLLNTIECKRKNELAAFRTALSGGNDSFTSTKYFPYCYFLSHKTPDFHISVKGYHTDYKGTEWGLQENRLGSNLNYGGVMTMMATGNEYYDINPLTDYSAIPGTSAPRWDDQKLWDHSVGDWQSPAGTNDDCGGYVEGTRGVMYMYLDHDGFSGFKAYFPYEDGIVCLGCALDGPETLYTTVEQAFRDGALFDDYLLPKGEQVQNGGFSYINLGDAPMTVSAKEVTGAWNRNSPAQSPDPITGNIFKLSIDHSDIKEYAYAIVSTKASSDKIKAIINTPNEQSVVYSDGMKVTVLHENGTSRITIE